MIPSNVDPRRPDKVQRYKPTQPNGNAPGDDLTPDYMNILGSESPATANADAPTELTTEEQRPAQDNEGAAAISVLPVSPQYGIATLPASIETLSETSTPPTDTVTETIAKSSDGDNKDLHSTPSRNDRFKVVKIASLEPFRRGRWKCMDYVDQTAPPSSTASKTQNAPLYMHTQSLPQQHFQQLLVQGGYANPQYFQNVPAQMIPQNQYFYPAPQNMQGQNLQQQMGVPPNSVYITAGGQQYIQQSVVPNSVGGFTVQTYPNLQYVPAQNQNSAFIPTSQNVNTQIPPNFQQSQTYAGQPSVSQPNITQPVVNGHVFPPNQSNDQVPTSLPTQVAKIAILTTQPQTIQNQVPQSISLPNNQSSQMQNVPVQAVLPTQQYNQIQQQNAQNFQPQLVQQINQNNHQLAQQVLTNVSGINQLQTQTTITQVNQLNPAQSVTNMPQMINIPTNVYANPQFVTSVNNAPVSEPNREPENADLASGEPTDGERGNSDDMARANPVVNPVNAIDNKIEQAMDLVKSHLMYTVREEVEVLKEKITELMEKIQQLETENNFLRSQLPKSQHVNPSGTPDPPQ